MLAAAAIVGGHPVFKNAKKRISLSTVFCLLCSFSLIYLLGSIFWFSSNLHLIPGSYARPEGGMHFSLGRKIPENRLMVIIPGHGHPERLNQLRNSLHALQKSAYSNSIGFVCVVYVWKKELIKETVNVLDICKVEFSSGLWTNHMLRVNSYSDSATHVVVMMDDIDAKFVNLGGLLDTMTEASFDVASPAIPDWQTKSSLPRNNCMAHTTGHVDILFTVFTASMWKCWLHQIDPSINVLGWGYDLTLADVCHAEIGIVDHEIAYHNPICPLDNGNCNIRSYDDSDASRQMYEWIMHATASTTVKEADAYFHEVAFLRPIKAPYCRLVKFHLGNDRFHLSTTHRGGWRGVIQYMKRAGHLIPTTSFNHFGSIELTDSIPIPTPSHNHSGSVELIDSIEEWFVWEKRGVISKPWTGFAHLIMSKDLPSHALENDLDVLDNYFETEEFLQSAQNCVALFLFTQGIADQVADKLEELGIQHVKTCVVHHPMVIEDTAISYNINTDLNAAFSNKSAVILLGQQYRRVATLHRLKTTKQKVWLPSRTDNPWLANKIQAELDFEGVEMDEKVKVTRVESNEEYDILVRQNIIIVDLWAAGANNSILEAIALAAPFLIRKLPGPVEYLGEGYPLLFSSFDELQALIDDEDKLKKKMMRAHIYLKSMDKDKLSLESFANQIENCTLEAMRNWVKPA